MREENCARALAASVGNKHSVPSRQAVWPFVGPHFDIVFLALNEKCNDTKTEQKNDRFNSMANAIVLNGIATNTSINAE